MKSLNARADWESSSSAAITTKRCAVWSTSLISIPWPRWLRNGPTISSLRENLEWLRSLPQGPVRIDGLPDVQFVHGSPVNEDEYVVTVGDAVEPLMAAPAMSRSSGTLICREALC